MFQVQDQSLRPLTTAHLAQTMSLLVLSNQELHDKVLAELSSNPALELVEERVCPECQRKIHGPGRCPVCSRTAVQDEPIVFLSPRDSYRPSRRQSDDDFPYRQEPAAPEDRTIFVLRQLAADLLPEDRELAIYILSSLDDDGFLVDPPAFIAQTTRSTITQVRRVLELISTAEPIGLATEGPRQALIVQLKQFPDNPRVQVACRMIEETFAELGRGEYDKIAKALDVKSSLVHEATEFIQDNLNPYPGRAYWGSGREPESGDPNVYHRPDVVINTNPIEEEGPLVVEIFSPISGWLRVNPLFNKALKEADKDDSEELNEHLEKANLFVKCIQQRNNTMRLLMELLVTKQRQYILEGARHLTPMTRAEVADHIGVHESTVSRAVSNKSVALPDGRIIPLAKFFDRSLSVRDRIKEMVREEREPLTDDAIASQLKKDGIKIARRTVAKYRSIEGILPARLRAKKKLSTAA